MLAFEVYYLSGRVYATDFQNRQCAEWPPHPARFFSALVAAFYESGLGQVERKALEWLERQEPPSISASEAYERRGVRAYVPVNDPEASGKDGNPFIPIGRKRQPRYFPSFHPEKPFVYFIWPCTEPEQQIELQQHIQALSNIAERVTYLGSSASLVQVRLCPSAPSPTFVPDEAGEVVLRVIGPGRLQSLSEAYELGNRPPPSRWAAYRQVSEVGPESSAATSVFGDIFVFWLKSPRGQRLSIQRTLAVTNAMRGRLLQLAGGRPPDLLTGHDRHPHCAYIALPFVGRQYADGHIIGVALVLPKRISPDDRRSVLRVLGTLKDKPLLFIPGRGQWTMEHIISGTAQLETLRVQTWTNPAYEWCSVTPVLLDQFPKDKPGRTAGEIIARSCGYIGLPAPVDIKISPYASLVGVEPACQFLTRRHPGNVPRYATHLTLTFDRRVRGPIVLGAGRYFGLGLLRPMAAS
jgi:CRISPR-associated protein Csb2